MRTGFFPTVFWIFETGLRIQMAGYRCYATDKLLAKGLAPITISGLIKQREKWARGCIYSLRRIGILLNPKLSLRMKMEHTACRLYWESFIRRLIYILMAVLFMLGRGNRRHTERFHVELPVVVECGNAGQGKEFYIQDISEGGFALWCKGESEESVFARGEDLWVILEDRYYRANVISQGNPV